MRAAWLAAICCFPVAFAWPANARAPRQLPDFAVARSPLRAGPACVAGRVIVKLTPEAASALAAPGVQAASGNLAAALQQAGVRTARPLFPQLRPARGAHISATTRAGTVRLHYPQRAARAPRGALIPELENIFVLELAPGQGVMAAVRALRRNPDVIYAEPDYVMNASLVPNDPSYAATGTYWPGPDMWGLYAIGSEAAWDVTTGSAAVTLAVVDTGLDADHPDIASRVWSNTGEIPGNSLDDDANGFVDDVAGWDFAYGDNDPADGHGHGTHVSGTIGAATNNSLGIAGINWLGKVMPVKALNDSGSGPDSEIAQAMTYAADNGADVMNMSLGGWGYSQLMADAATYANALGCIVVAAAGNSADDASRYSPAGLRDVVSVAASDTDDFRAYFTNYGRIVDLSAPGCCILSLQPDAGYVTGSGTSMAAPHVTGVLGLLISTHPAWSVAQLVARMNGTTDDIDDLNPGYEYLLGMGRLNAAAALTTSTERERAYLTSLTMDDPAGNGNGQAEPGEQIELVTAVKHFAGSSPDFTATLSTSDPYVTLTDPVASFGAVSGWRTADNSADPLVLDLAADTPLLYQVLLDLHLAGSGYEEDYQFSLPVLRYLLGWPQAVGQEWRLHPVLADVDEDGTTEAVVATGNGVHVLKGDGSEAPGWPANPSAASFMSNYITPCVGDLDGDGSPEVVCLLDEYEFGLPTTLYAWRQDGTLLTGFPVEPANFPETCCLADLDGVPGLEILLMTTDLNYLGRIEVYRYDGTVYSGWSQGSVRLDPPALWDYAGIGVGDINGDSAPEVVALEDRLLFSYLPDRVWAWRANGSLLPGFPVEMPADIYGWYSPAGPALGDIDGDGVLDLLASTGEYLYALKGTGAVISGWPRYGGSPSLADLDRDGRLEIVAAGPDHLRVYSAGGALLWTGVAPGAILWDATVADLDGDGSLEVLARDGHDTVHCWRADGDPYAEFPVSMAASPDRPGNESSVAVGDIDGNGYTDLITGNGPTDDYLYALAAPGEYRAYVAWAMHSANPRRDGCYAPPGLDAIAVGSALPDALAWEETFAASITYLNQGSGPWAQADDYRLALLDGTDHWGFTSLPIDHDVSPGGSYTFDFPISAPPVTTLRYPEAATQTTPGQLDRLPTGWGLARGATPLFAADVAHEIAVSRFPDIQPGTAGAWARFYVEECAGRVPLIVAGYPEGTYLPALPVSRDQMAVFIQRALDLPLPTPIGRFTDVAPDRWAAAQIEALAEAGIVGGYEDGSYRPTQVVNRDAMAVFVARGLAGGDTAVPTGPPTATFWDVLVSHWAFKYVEYAVSHQVVGGYPDGTYRPGNPVSRDQMAVFVYRGFVQPTGAAVVLAGPAVTADAPSGVCGWPSAAQGPAADPGYAYVTSDAVRLGPGLAFGPFWEVKFELRSASTPEVPATGPYTHTRSLSPSELDDAKTAAMASGDPYYTVSWDLPAGLASGDYVLVVSVEDTSGARREITRRFAFTVQ